MIVFFELAPLIKMETQGPSQESGPLDENAMSSVFFFTEQENKKVADSEANTIY